MNGRTLFAVAAALAVAGVGYALTGSPGQPSAPAPVKAVDPKFTPEAEKASKELLENFGDVRAWLTLTDFLIREGRTETAVTALESGLDAIPGSADLWVQLGIALVAHANGEVVPAARLAFDRAARLEPDHPAPGYFLGLAWMQSGDVDKALGSWEALKARSAPDAPWVPMLDRAINGARTMQAMGLGEMMAAGGPPAGAQSGGQSGQPAGQMGGMPAPRE